MTIDALHAPVDRARDTADAAGANSARDANIFPCPRCSRPLAVSVSRCGGCGTRLVAGVPLLKVSAFVGLGLLVGLTVGGGLVGVLTTVTRPIEAPTAATPVGLAPSAAPAASPLPAPSTIGGPGVVPVPPDVPSAALTALRQSTTVNQRLLADADLLARTMAARDPSPADIAPLLRNLASTAASGDRIAMAVGTWVDGRAVSQALAEFYASIDRIAQDGLAASIANDRAYRDAARRMLIVLDGLAGLDAATRGLAATVDVDLPPLSSSGG